MYSEIPKIPNYLRLDKIMQTTEMGVDFFKEIMRKFHMCSAFLCNDSIKFVTTVRDNSIYKLPPKTTSTVHVIICLDRDYWDWRRKQYRSFFFPHLLYTVKS